MDGSSLNIYSVVPSNLMPFQVLAERFVIKTGSDSKDRAYFYIDDEVTHYFLEPSMVVLEMDDEVIAASDDTELDEEEDE